MRSLFALALASSLAACGGEVPNPPPPGDVRIGTGGADGLPGFVPFMEGDQLELVPGSQGGFHVFVNLALPPGSEGELTDRPLVRRVARRASDGVLVSRTERRESLEADEEGGLETPASLPLFLCPTPIGVSVADELIELEVEVKHPSGAPVRAGRARFLPTCPEGQQAEFCRSICFG